MSTNINKVLYKDHTGELIDSCHCSRCYEKRIEGLSLKDRMAVWFQYACEICGNKRCPHNIDHRNVCTNSNQEIMYEEEPPR